MLPEGFVSLRPGLEQFQGLVDRHFFVGQVRGHWGGIAGAPLATLHKSRRSAQTHHKRFALGIFTQSNRREFNTLHFSFDLRFESMPELSTAISTVESAEKVHPVLFPARDLVEHILHPRRELKIDVFREMIPEADG